MPNDVLVKVESVSKKFCRSLKRSLWYGLKDVGSELNPIGRNGSVSGSNGPHPPLRKDEFWAVKDVSFELQRGECLGLIGGNGAGKTTLLKMLNGLLKLDHGRIEIRGRVGALVALGAGFNPVLTGRENIYVNGSILGLTKKEIDSKSEEIIDFSGIEEFIDAPVQTYSSGMIVRLGFSVASMLKPDVLLVDEVLAVGDQQFRLKAQQAMRSVRAQGTAIIMVSHNMHEITGNTQRCLWLEDGSIRMTGATQWVCSEYLSAQTVDAAGSAVYHYSPNRQGHTPLKTFTHSLKTVSAQGVPALQDCDQTLKLSLEFTAALPIHDNIVHAVNLVTAGDSYIARAALCDQLSANTGEQFSRTLIINLPELLPGLYRLEYFLWLEGGDMLEGMLNLLQFEVAPATALARLKNINPSYFIGKMGDNSKGSIPLSMTMQCEK